MRDADRRKAQTEHALKPQSEDLLYALGWLAFGWLIWAPPWKPYYITIFVWKFQVWPWLVWCSFLLAVVFYLYAVYVIGDWSLYLVTGKGLAHRFDNKQNSQQQGDE